MSDDTKKLFDPRRALRGAEEAARLLDRPPPEGYRAEWAAHLAREQKSAETTTESALAFRVGAEWLGLPALWVAEVLPVRAAHSLPHRRGRAVTGIVNVRGELLPCFSLGKALEIAPAAQVAGKARMLVAGRGARRLAFGVDDVFGVVEFDATRARPAPGRGGVVTRVVDWTERSLGLIDPEALWTVLERSLA